MEKEGMEGGEPHCKSLSTGLGICRLDYCNSLLAGITKVYLFCFQLVHNASACLISGA